MVRTVRRAEGTGAVVMHAEQEALAMRCCMRKGHRDFQRIIKRDQMWLVGLRSQNAPRVVTKLARCWTRNEAPAARSLRDLARF